jgi:hypothetical protein
MIVRSSQYPTGLTLTGDNHRLIENRANVRYPPLHATGDALITRRSPVSGLTDAPGKRKNSGHARTTNFDILAR